MIRENGIGLEVPVSASEHNLNLSEADGYLSLGRSGETARVDEPFAGKGGYFPIFLDSHLAMDT